MSRAINQVPARTFSDHTLLGETDVTRPWLDVPVPASSSCGLPLLSEPRDTLSKEDGVL